MLTNSALLLPLLLLMALCVIWATSQRDTRPSMRPVVSAVAGVTGGLALWGLAPFGALAVQVGWQGSLSVLAIILISAGAPLLAGLAAFRHHERGASVVAAGLTAGTLGVIVFVGLEIASMLWAPQRVPLVWANPDPSVAHGTIDEIRISLGDAAVQFEGLLLFGPLIGLVIGASVAVLEPTRSRAHLT